MENWSNEELEARYGGLEDNIKPVRGKYCLRRCERGSFSG